MLHGLGGREMTLSKRERNTGAGNLLGMTYGHT